MSKIKIEIKPFYAIILILAGLALTILKPFLSIILSAMVLSYVTYPVYTWLNSRIYNRTASALLTVMLLVLVVTIPAVFSVQALINEARALIPFAQAYLLGDSAGLLKLVGLDDPGIIKFLTSSLVKAGDSVAGVLTNYIIGLPRTLAGIFITVFLTYYLLKDGKQLVTYSKGIIPLKPASQDMLLRRFNEVTFAVVYGNIVVAVIQGVLTSIGFFVFGVPSPLIWGIVTIFTSLIPFLGAYIVWLPAALFMILAGNADGETGIVVRGIALLLYGLLVISSIDNILKPKLIGNRAGLHPALVLLGAIGGLATVGITGLIIGPVVIALAASVIQIASKSRGFKNGVS